MKTSKDALQSAIGYLGAIEIEAREPRAFTRYAMPTPGGKWVAFSEGTLAKFADGALNHFRYQVTIGRAFVLLPQWWKPTHRSTFRCGCGKSPDSAKVNYALHAHCLGKGFERIAADLETGAEVPT